MTLVIKLTKMKNPVRPILFSVIRGINSKPKTKIAPFSGAFFRRNRWFLGVKPGEIASNVMRQCIYLAAKAGIDKLLKKNIFGVTTASFRKVRYYKC